MTPIVRSLRSAIKRCNLLLLVLVVIIGSCKRRIEVTGHSPAFKIVEDKVNTLFQEKKETEGLRLMDSLLKNSSDLTLDDKYRAYGLHYVYYQKDRGDFKKALAYGDSMLTVAKQNTDNKQYVAQYVDANLAIGDSYFNLQQYNDAYRYLFQGYLVGKNNLDRPAMSSYMYRMGMITYKMENFKLAKEYFKKSYEYCDMIPGNFVNFYHIQELLDNIALSYKHNNQTDSAIIYFDRSLAFINKYGVQFKHLPNMLDMARGVVYGNKAEIHAANGNYPEAISLLKKSININLQKGNDNNDALLTEIKLARIYYDDKQDAELFGLLTDIGTQLDSIKNTDAEADWNQLMSKYYERKNEIPKAFSYLQAYNTLNNANIKKLDLLRASDINKQFENYEKQQQIDQLSSNNKIQLIFLYVTIVFVIMALIIIFLVYRNWRRSKKDVATVNLLNQQINQQNGILENALNELKVNAQEKDRILRTVAHDLRNPIGGIASLTAMMAEDEYTEEQKELINLVKETSINSLELINEILEATNAVSMELHQEMAEINSLVNNSVELLRFKALEKGQKIFFEPLSSPFELLISREKIWRVISNLISNAIKFSPTGAPIFVKVTMEAQQVVISVLDNGIGIPDKLKDKVFNMFTTAQRPGTAGEKSFGLGLSICRQIMERSGGKIWFDSSKHGTIFSISLPILPEKAKTAASAQKLSVPFS